MVHLFLYENSLVVRTPQIPGEREPSQMHAWRLGEVAQVRILFLVQNFKIKDMKNSNYWEEIFSMVITLFFLGCWVVNIVKFVNCDFDAPYKEEFIHFVGIIIPPSSIITVWF